jgi:hypothetical protein
MALGMVLQTQEREPLWVAVVEVETHSDLKVDWGVCLNKKEKKKKKM